MSKSLLKKSLAYVNTARSDLNKEGCKVINEKDKVGINKKTPKKRSNSTSREGNNY